MKRTHKTFAGSEHGAVTIEFVCTLPLFVAMLAFTFEFGQFFLAHQSAVHNARSASRYLSRIDLSDWDLREDAFEDAARIIRTGQISGGSPPTYLQGVCDRAENCIRMFNGNERGRLRFVAYYKPTLLSFVGIGNLGIPIAVREDFAVVGF